MPRALSGRRLLSVLTLLIVTVACAARPVPEIKTEPSRAIGPIRVPTNLANGRVEIAIVEAYSLGVTASIPITISATRRTIRGPIAARVVTTGMGGRAFRRRYWSAASRLLQSPCRQVGDRRRPSTGMAAMNRASSCPVTPTY